MDKSEFTSSRLIKEVLFLENEGTRYELSRQKPRSNQQDKYQFARLHPGAVFQQNLYFSTISVLTVVEKTPFL